MANQIPAGKVAKIGFKRNRLRSNALLCVVLTYEDGSKVEVSAVIGKAEENAFARWIFGASPDELTDQSGETIKLPVDGVKRLPSY